MADKTVLELVMDSLSGKNVFPPGMKIGECTEPYCVLKDDGASKMASFSSQVQYYTLMCYVPANTYTELTRYKKACKEALTALYPTIIPTGVETPSFYDDTVKAHMSSVMYRSSVRAEQL